MRASDRASLVWVACGSAVGLLGHVGLYWIWVHWIVCKGPVSGTSGGFGGVVLVWLGFKFGAGLVLVCGWDLGWPGIFRV